MFDEDRFKTVTSFEELKTLVEEDKNINGMGAATANRYPIRFVLLTTSMIALSLSCICSKNVGWLFKVLING